MRPLWGKGCTYSFGRQKRLELGLFLLRFQAVGTATDAREQLSE